MIENLQNIQAPVWHPFTQMKGAKVLRCVHAEKEFLQLESGEKLVDAISSWWVNVHGHGHPLIAQKLSEQFRQIDHVIFAGFTHPGAESLAAKITQVLGKGFDKVFFSDNGSTSVEVAIKQAIQYHANRGMPRKGVVALADAYHGDTFGAMSSSQRSPFTEAFEDYFFEVKSLDMQQPIEVISAQFESILQENPPCAFIFEPLVQGAGGMKMYDPEKLERLMRLCQSNEVLAIADEVMTGFGRTGKMFAFQHLNVKPDIICLSKGLTGGVLPLGLTVCSQKIFDSFLSEDHSKTFFHGHSYTGNPLSCAASLASLEIFEQPQTWENIDRICRFNSDFADILIDDKRFENVRQRGTILAFDLNVKESQTGYFNARRDQIYHYFLERGLLMRPLGNVIYIMPPYCISDSSLDRIKKAVLEFPC